MKKVIFIVGMVFLFAVSISEIGVATNRVGTDAQVMYRLYNENNGEHFYTSSSSERDFLRQSEWKFEGAGWQAPNSGNNVYRLYNPNAGDHHYTLSANERDGLVRFGWKYEGISWYSDNNETQPVYRAYNPNAFTGTHNYTISQEEQNGLIKSGWQDESVGWYGVVRNYDLNSTIETNGTNVLAEWQRTSNFDPTFSNINITLFNDSNEKIIVDSGNLKFIYDDKTLGPDTLNANFSKKSFIEPFQTVTFVDLFSDFIGERALGGFKIYYKSEPVQIKPSVYPN